MTHLKSNVNCCLPTESILVNCCLEPSSKTLAFFPHCFDGKLGVIGVDSQLGFELEQRGILQYSHLIFGLVV